MSLAVNIRHFREDDWDSLLELINVSDRVDLAGFTTTSPALRHRLCAPAVNTTDSLFVAELNGTLVGYVVVYLRHHEGFDRAGTAGIVLPACRRRGIGAGLMTRAEERARLWKRQVPLFLDMSVRERVTGATELAQSRGMTAIRYFFYMECADLENLPESGLPTGYYIRAYHPLQDREAFVRAYNAGFSDHWGYVAVTPEQEAHRMRAVGFNSEDSLLAMTDSGEIAGVCLLIYPAAELGELSANPPMIDDLAVVPSQRRRGIGRALLVAGMRRIRAAGHTAASLVVDAENPNQALRLYESTGFVIRSRTAAFRKELV